METFREFLKITPQEESAFTKEIADIFIKNFVNSSAMRISCAVSRLLDRSAGDTPLEDKHNIFYNAYFNTAMLLEWLEKKRNGENINPIVSFNGIKDIVRNEEDNLLFEIAIENMEGCTFDDYINEIKEITEKYNTKLIRYGKENDFIKKD